MSIFKFLLLAGSVFAGALGMNWLMNGDLDLIKSTIIAIAVASGVSFGKWYRKNYSSANE